MYAPKMCVFAAFAAFVAFAPIAVAVFAPVFAPTLLASVVCAAPKMCVFAAFAAFVAFALIAVAVFVPVFAPVFAPTQKNCAPLPARVGVLCVGCV